MKHISLHKRGSNESGFHYFSVGMGFGDTIVFSETSHYPALTHSEEREYEAFITIQSEHRYLLLACLQNSLIPNILDEVGQWVLETLPSPEGLSSQIEPAQAVALADLDEQILALVQVIYTQGRLQSLADVRRWLRYYHVPFKESIWNGI